MKSKLKKLILFILCLIVVMLACSLQPEYVTENDPPSEDVNNPAPPEPEEPANQPEAPVEEPESPSEMPAPPASNNLEPVGFAVQKECQKANPCTVDGESHTNGTELQIISTDGQISYSIYLPAKGVVSHIASRVDFDKPGNLTFIFRNYQSNQYEIYENQSVIQTFDATNVRSILGVPGRNVFAICYLPGRGTDSGNSEIHVYPGTEPLVTSYDKLKLVLPVGIRDDGGDPPGYLDLWFTYEMYGVGGDIIFPPDNGLFYVEGNQETPLEILSEAGPTFSNITRDGHMAAYYGGSNKGMTIKNLETNVETSFPLLPEIDRGAGWAFFTPDGQRLAWMEAKGSGVDGTLEIFIRAGAVDGSILADIPTSDFAEELSWFVPAGWLDNERLLVWSDTFAVNDTPFVLVLQVNNSTSPESYDGVFVSLVYE